MKKLLSLVLILAVAPICQARPAPKARKAVANIDPTAAALLQKSAQAYARLGSASMSFSVLDKRLAQGKTTTQRITGTIAFARPDKAKLQFNDGHQVTLVLSDGVRFVRQTQPREYQEFKIEPNTNANYIESVLRNIPSGLGIFLHLMAADEWKYANRLFTNQKMTLLPRNGVSLTAKLVGSSSPPITFSLYFDPINHLLRRVEAKGSAEGQTRHDITTLTRTRLNPKLLPSAFAFTPGPGAKNTYIPR